MTKLAPSGRSGTRAPEFFPSRCTTVIVDKACLKDLVLVGLPSSTSAFLT